MGISRSALKILMKEASRRRFEGRLLTLGRQDVLFSEEVLRVVAREFGFKLAQTEPAAPSHNPALAEEGCIGDDWLFGSLGFSGVETLDFSDFESARHVFDMNRPAAEIPAGLAERFDVILDAGTIEHVFNIPNALGGIFRMLKPGGRVIHIAPSSNHMDHGFYMFSPTLFWDYYQANGFEINAMQVCRSTGHWKDDPWQICDYFPGSLDHLGIGGLDESAYAVVCVATKVPGATGHVVPQQGYYQRAWKSRKLAYQRKPAGKPRRARVSLIEAVKGRIRRRPILYGVLRFPFQFARFLRWGPAEPPETKAKSLGLKVAAYY
ncbi:MAG: class I SAM-dependent methyltransferase [Elusimicrobia bacterium]|nr:class I SAM-dependent methyltransferase [Elusimicrobiota bacterium]